MIKYISGLSNINVVNFKTFGTINNMLSLLVIIVIIYFCFHNVLAYRVHPFSVWTLHQKCDFSVMKYTFIFVTFL